METPASSAIPTVLPRKPHEERRIKQFEQNGEEISKTYCESDSDNPVMIPPVPNLSPYIDKYQEGEELSESNRDSKQRQEDYEAEVKVYRALEGLKEKITVLHSFKYTHGDYQSFAGDHVFTSGKKTGKPCSLKPRDIEGECDFLIMGGEFFVVIEVKNLVIEPAQDCEITRQNKALTGTFKKSFEQRMKTVNFIRKIGGTDTDIEILHFTAYPDLSNEFLEEFQLNGSQKSTLILKEDLKCFGDWWNKTVPLVLSSEAKSARKEKSDSTVLQRIRHIMLAMHCTENNNLNTFKCSLGWNILDIYQKLRDGIMTFESKKRDQNPSVFEAPDIVQEYIGIKYLTKEQHTAYNSSQQLNWIFGPAGSGKTVVMCANMIQLALSDEGNKVVVFKFTGDGNNCRFYRDACDRARIDYDLEIIIADSKMRKPSYIFDLISRSKKKVLILETKIDAVYCDIRTPFSDITWLTETLQLLHGAGSKCNVLVDDLQCVLDANSWSIDNFMNAILKFSLTNTAWIAYDSGQSFSLSNINVNEMGEYLVDELPHFSNGKWKRLSVNMRNTYDLAEALSVIRNRFSKYLEFHSSEYGRFASEFVLPTQVSGHFIRGPKLVIHALKGYDTDLIIRILNEELEKLVCGRDDSKNPDVGIIYGYDDLEETKELVKSTVKHYTTNTANSIQLCDSFSCYSAEWPAVIVLQQMQPDEECLNSEIYTRISRARVYCSVILYPGPEYCETPNMFTIYDYSYIMWIHMLAELSGIATILEHPV